MKECPSFKKKTALMLIGVFKTGIFLSFLQKVGYGAGTSSFMESSALVQQCCRYARLSWFLHFPTPVQTDYSTPLPMKYGERPILWHSQECCHQHPRQLHYPALKLGQAAVNQPYGWSAIGKLETEPVGKTLTSKPSGMPNGRWPLWNSDSIHAKIL